MTWIVLGVPLLLAVPSPAATPTTTAALDARCYTAGAQMTVTGSGFVPNAPLSILGGAAPQLATADGTGVLEPTLLKAPSVHTITPAAITIRIRDDQDAAIVAATRTHVVREPFASNAPVAGAPRETTTWRFAGFAPDQPIYGHFRLRGATHRNYLFGMATGACGTLVVRARRVPLTRSLPGLWELKLDQRARYARDTPGRLITFRIYRPVA